MTVKTDQKLEHFDGRFGKVVVFGYTKGLIKVSVPYNVRVEEDKQVNLVANRGLPVVSTENLSRD